MRDHLRGLVLTGLAALILTLLLLSYAGYPLRDFDHVLIGREDDTSGENIELTLNLYWVLTFPLTACAGYALVRYLTGTSALCGGLIGLGLAFSSFRFAHLERMELFSTHLLLLSVYGWHRYLDVPSTPRAIIVGLMFGITAISSGYLAAFSAIMVGIIFLYAMVLKPALVDNAALIKLALAAALFLPFFAFRLNNTDFPAGQSFAEIQANAATMRDWFRGNSALYRPLMPERGEWSLFFGFVPLILVIVAWQGRHEMEPAPADRVFSHRHLLYLYTGLLLGGYLLTLGAVIHISDHLKIPSPYLILLQLPGVGGLRFPNRFIALPYVALAVLAGLALNDLGNTLPRRQWFMLLVIGTVIGVAELLPAPFAE